MHFAPHLGFANLLHFAQPNVSSIKTISLCPHMCIVYLHLLNQLISLSVVLKVLRFVFSLNLRKIMKRIASNAHV